MKKIAFYILACLAWCIPNFGNSFMNVHADMATFFGHYSEDLKYLSCYVDNLQNVRCKKTGFIGASHSSEFFEYIEIPEFQNKKYLWLEEGSVSNGGYDGLCALRSTGRIDCIGSLSGFQDSYNTLASSHGMIKSISFSKIGKFESCAVFYDGYIHCLSGGGSGVINNNIPTLYGDRVWESVVVYNNYACAINSESEIHCFGGKVGLNTLKTLLQSYNAKRLIPWKISNNIYYRYGSYGDIFCFIDVENRVICLNSASVSSSTGFELYDTIDNDEYIDFYRYGSNKNDYCYINRLRFLSCAGTSVGVFLPSKEILYVYNFSNTYYPYIVHIRTNNFIENKYYYVPNNPSDLNRHDIYDPEDGKTFHPQFSYIIDTQAVCDMYDVNDNKNSTQHYISYKIRDLTNKKSPGNTSIISKNVDASFAKKTKGELFNAFNSGAFQLGNYYNNINDVGYFDDGVYTGLKFDIESALFGGLKTVFKYTISENKRDYIEGFYIYGEGENFRISYNSNSGSKQYVDLHGTSVPIYNTSPGYYNFSLNTYYAFEDIFNAIKYYDPDWSGSELYFDWKIPNIFDYTVTIKGVSFLYSDIKYSSKFCIYYDISDEEYEHIDIDEDGKITYDNGEITGEVIFDNINNEYCIWDKNGCIGKVKTKIHYGQDGKPIKKGKFQEITGKTGESGNGDGGDDTKTGSGWFIIDCIKNGVKDCLYNKLFGNEEKNLITNFFGLFAIVLPEDPNFNITVALPKLNEDFKFELFTSEVEVSLVEDELNIVNIEHSNDNGKKFIVFLLVCFYILVRIILVGVFLLIFSLFWMLIRKLLGYMFGNNMNPEGKPGNVWIMTFFGIFIVLVFYHFLQIFIFISSVMDFSNTVIIYINFLFTYIVSIFGEYTFFVTLVNLFFNATSLALPLYLLWMLFLSFGRNEVILG